MHFCITLYSTGRLCLPTCCTPLSALKLAVEVRCSESRYYDWRIHDGVHFCLSRFAAAPWFYSHRTLCPLYAWRISTISYKKVVLQTAWTFPCRKRHDFKLFILLVFQRTCMVCVQVRACVCVCVFVYTLCLYSCVRAFACVCVHVCV